jgi:hypothetical protein
MEGAWEKISPLADSLLARGVTDIFPRQTFWVGAPLMGLPHGACDDREWKSLSFNTIFTYVLRMKAAFFSPTLSFENGVRNEPSFG